MTVNKGVDLRVSRSVELLASLQHIASAFARKEEQLARDLGGRRYAEKRKHREGIEKSDARLHTEVAAADAALKREESRLKALDQRRRAHVERARSTGLRNLPKRARQAKERWMGDLQMRHFQAERKLAADREALDAANARVAATQAAQRTTLYSLNHHARRFFRGYWTLQRVLRAPADAAKGPPAAGNEEQLAKDFQAQLSDAEDLLLAFRRLQVPRLFSYLPLPALIPIVLAAAALLAYRLGPGALAYGIAFGFGIALLACFGFLHQIGFRQAKPSAGPIRAVLDEAARTHAAYAAAATARIERKRRESQKVFERTAAAIAEQWNRSDAVEAEFEEAERRKIETQTPRILAKMEASLRPKLECIAAAHNETVKRLTTEAEGRKEQVDDALESELATVVADEKARWDKLVEDWNRQIVPIYETIGAMNAATAASFPPWDGTLVDAWAPAARFTPVTKFGDLELDHGNSAGALPKDQRLALPGPRDVSVPLALSSPMEGSLLFETAESGGSTVIGTLNNVILRLLASTPPGKLSFTIIDPVGLGQNFAGLMHLADYEESLINRRIWTQREQIEDRLAELSEHIEKVIQMYLRNEYATITEYNEQAGSVAEKYHFLVVADFPANFSEIAAKRLQSIAMSGPRCGIYTLIHWDRRQPLPDGFVPDDLRAGSVRIQHEDPRADYVLETPESLPGVTLRLDSPPDADLAARFVHKIGKSSIDSNRVEVPFVQIAPKEAEVWTNDTTNELRVPIGRTGATKLQYLALGKGTRQHALFAGKTGSGKSTLFHVIVTNLALACSPEQVEFYLVDFKKGVEFKCYATKRLPQARVVAIESDREFGLSVLQRLDEELKRRGDLFRKLGVQDLAGYKRAGGAEPLPRSLLIIDEFQEFFVEDDPISQTASLLLDRIVRQGRAFGIHALLGSQTLGGAYSLARATLGQMVVRVALQCNEADAHLIMDDNNSAPRLLSRPGEGIYNDAAGALEGNSPFQVVWLPDEERDAWLDKVRALAEQRHDPHGSPIVFEGNSPADLRENDRLASLLESEPTAAPVTVHAWLGAPNSIKGPTEAVFHRQSGNNLLIVGQREEAALTMLGVSLISVAAHYPVGGARFVVFESTNPGSRDAEFVEQVVKVIPHEVTVARGPDVAEVMNQFWAQMKARSSGEEAAGGAVFVFVQGLQKFKKLKHEGEFDFSMGGAEAAASTGAQFNELISEGSSHGFHIIASIDTFNNINRFMNRKALSEFEMRVVFQMSANDSASLIDSPKASNLGLHRALFYNEHEGYLETFRPYAAPDAEWIREAGERLWRRARLGMVR